MKCRAKKLSDSDKALIEKLANFITSIQRTTYRRAYEVMILKYYCKEFVVRDGLQVPILPPPEECPTFNQFYYWVRKFSRPINYETETGKKG